MTIVASNSLTISNVNDGTITHIAYANSPDGTDRFTTVYPNLNLIEDGKFVKPISSKWKTDGTTISKDDITGYFKVKFNGGSLNRTYYGGSMSTIPIGQKYSVYIKAYSLESSLNIKMGSVDTYQAVTVTNNSNIPKTYKAEGLVRGSSDTFGIFGGLTTTLGTLFISEIKVEPGSTATPYMPSASEVTTADWPSYIGQYSDFISTASTDPAKYAPWTVFKGKDGATGPQGPQGNTGPQGPTGPAGSNGAPGKIVSNTEPTTRFKGLTWKYSGTTDLTASDGTVIHPNTEYYYNGTNWMINFLSANNIDANSITAEKINGTDLEVKNGKFTDGVIETSWKNGTVAGNTNIENDHLIITRTDSSVNTTNSIGLDSTQGLIMVYTENSTGRTISVGTNFQGMSLKDSTGTSASISPAGVKLSSDVNWTQIGNIGGRRAEWKRENNRVTMNIHGGNGDGFPVITSGGTLLGILPTNARPPSDISMPATAQGAGATAQISINSTGEVRCYRWGGDSVYFGAYISYYVE